MRNHGISCFFAALLAALPSAAGGISSFEAATGPQNYVVTHHPVVLPHLVPSAWWTTSYARDPLVYRDASGKQVGDAIVSHWVQSEIAASLGLFERFELGIAAPAYYVQGAGFDGQGLQGAGSGDVRVVGKAQLTPWKEGFAASLRVSSDLLPLAQLLRSNDVAASLSGERIPNIAPSLNVGFHSRALRVAAEAGFLWRQGRELYPDTLAAGSQVTYGAAAEFQLFSDDVFLTADVHGRAAPAALGSDRNRFPLQGDIAIKSFVGPFLWSLGAGTGLIADVGAPDVRVFAALGWYARPVPAPLDQDGDGIADERDACPVQAEDPDGFEDGDGCPDDDNDQDGVPDSADACPLEAETVNDFEDEDGCPDEAPPVDPLVVVKVDRIDILEKVYFELNSDQILPVSYGILGRLARVLQDRPGIRRVRVEGHTDSDGDAAYNEALSLRRAESVMRFLVEAGGVEPERLVAEGLGESRPIDTNDTPAGKQNNRRVEFHIIDPMPVDAPASPSHADTSEETSTEGVEGGVGSEGSVDVKAEMRRLLDDALSAPDLDLPEGENEAGEDGDEGGADATDAGPAPVSDPSREGMDAGQEMDSGPSELVPTGESPDLVPLP